VGSSANVGPPSGRPDTLGVERPRPGSDGEPSPPVGEGRSAAELGPGVLGRLLVQAAQPVAVADLAGRVLFLNRALEELTGVAPAEWAGQALAELILEPGRPGMAEALDRLRAGGGAQRFEAECRRGDGPPVPVEWFADLARDEAGTPRGLFALVTDISRRKQAERALAESERKFRELYDEAPFGYHEIDAEGVILTINRTECAMLGYRPEEMLGRPSYEFMAPESREVARRAIRAKVRGEQPLVPVERVFLRSDGRPLIVSIEDRLVRDAQGRGVGLRSTVQDITERKQTEAALVASERRARALFEGIEDGVFVHDFQGRILDANPAACRLLGYSREELLQLATRDIDDPEFASGFPDRLRKQMERGRASFEGRHRTKDGRVVPVEISTALIQFESQPAVLAVIRDITERIILEDTRLKFDEAQMRYALEMEAKNQALTQSEARYRQLTEGCLDAVVVADGAASIALFNPAAERTFGYPAAEVLGQPLTILMPEEFQARHLEGFGRYLLTRESRIVGHTVELLGRRKNGEVFPLELSLNAIDLSGELQFIGVIRDQAERQRMRAMLTQSERLASIGLLSAGVAHEINNPLAYVGNNLAVLERDLKGVQAMLAAYEAAHGHLAAAAPETLRQVLALSEEIDWPYVRDNLERLLARTRDGVQRVATIVQNLRGLARTAPPTMEEAPVSELVDTALEMLRGRLRRGRIEVQIDYGPTPPTLVCVAAQISQVLLNLLINAVQAIETSPRPEGGRIRIATPREDQFQVIEVADNGSGIAPENLDHLFDPFFTTKPAGEGTGLGLSISHGIITGHGGRIEVQSTVGQGTTFRLLLPIKS
jgi:two-component system NtrC family sensor kinase